LFTYDNDNDLDRFIRGMSEPTYDKYVGIIIEENEAFDESNAFRLTVEQKQEAIIKIKELKLNEV